MVGTSSGRLKGLAARSGWHSLPAVTDPPSLGAVLRVLDGLYDPAWAESWDAVGLVVGDRAAPVRRVLFAVDPAPAVVEEAAAWGADLLVTHHPLLLRPVHGVSMDHPKGRTVTALVRSGVALHVVHTNADVARPGVSDALADLLGVGATEPLRPLPADPLDKLVVFVPREDADRLVDALAAAGAGRVGAYERAAWTTTGTGTFTPLPGARPAVGSVGAREDVVEARVEMVVPRPAVPAVVAALRAAHPYEEPAFDLLPTVAPPTGRGLGRVGLLAEPAALGAFARRVAAALPATAAGLRVAGDPAGVVRRVAVCGGAGDDLFAEARSSGADVYVTADLRHHPATEALEHGGPALVDCAHWATEWPWLADAARRLTAALRAGGTTVETRVSRLSTDPWTDSVRGEPAAGPPEPTTAGPTAHDPRTDTDPDPGA
jgi:dinuclear metal center YbgI/SA1388 family protein